MLLIQRVIGGVGVLLVAGVLLGLVVRRRYAHWYFFSLYLLTVVALEWVFPLKPDWYSPNFYQVKEVLYNLLRFTMALEIGLRIFRSFPGAMATARRLILLVLIGTLVAMPPTTGTGASRSTPSTRNWIVPVSVAEVGGLGVTVAVKLTAWP